MRAAYIERPGPAGDIRHGELPAPRPGPTDVLVDVLATTVNHVDTFVRSGAFPTPLPLPFVVGRDLVGRVAAAGPGAPGFAVGDLVWCNSLGYDGRQGSAAEQAVVPVDRLYRLPGGVDPGVAVTMVHPAATAYLALFVHGRLRPGQTVVVAGGAGNVGAALVTLAATAGARVVATASARDAGHCRRIGAAEVLDYRDPDLTDRLRSACPDGIDLHLDTSGRNELEPLVDLLALRGRIVLLAGARSRPVLPAGALYMHDRGIVGFVISHATTAELAEAAGAVNRLLAAGRLAPREVVPMPLSALAEAHQMIERGELRGRRVVITP
ncbi:MULTISPECIES: NADPH:quinone reductase [Micromonospora]|uniref:NADPH:quinone reductase n=1 Tax=Micromonospora solifontis TaxID=2487138 RepID=A0ABX9WCA9_9ACTN|nr:MULTISPECIES: NADPH:quinone reductase [Micromonospora]NES16841.1 NADPH:quinone reductase [Micromonospora sp. PPF5-17B]NES38518.1 NADPH:quinone reductase [Micromonospora solifontis]NES58480.1 NADPH:quinone reductase [Micromonospora sp. PPF5-6]RNL95018.1 NADPH:quinone reductase [Micromonospora solifontis]